MSNLLLLLLLLFLPVPIHFHLQVVAGTAAVVVVVLYSDQWTKFLFPHTHTVEILVVMIINCGSIH